MGCAGPPYPPPPSLQWVPILLVSGALHIIVLKCEVSSLVCAAKSSFGAAEDLLKFKLVDVITCVIIVDIPTTTSDFFPTVSFVLCAAA